MVYDLIHLKETKFKKLVIFDFSSKRNKILRSFKLKLLQKRDLDILDAYNMLEDVIKVFYFLFFYFFLQSIYKGIASLAQTQM